MEATVLRPAMEARLCQDCATPRTANAASFPVSVRVSRLVESGCFRKQRNGITL
ncbi:hypothetical protein E2C01_095144 [Portunus trituberculatus]|uniref:Uncharacterized protein n=1 Tax=Portunus trituberculatus TaxID=210409 RepID=A0A5B7JYR5_PORTR|nr:hypothetical protein [Portunus trituberculatus]